MNRCLIRQILAAWFLVLILPDVYSSAEKPLPEERASAIILKMPVISAPLTATEMGSLTYLFFPRLVGNAMEVLGEQYPILNHSKISRVAEWFLSVTWQVPWDIFSHELGHYRAARSFGLDAQVHVTGWASGITNILSLPQAVLLKVASAGLNQQQLNTLTIYEEWAQDGSISYQESLAYLIPRIYLPLYCISSASLGTANPKETMTGSSDVLVYLDPENLGFHLNPNELIAVSTLPIIASGSFWAALIGQIEFLKTGQRRVPIPALHIGSVRIVAPDFNTLLTSQGPIVIGNMFLIIGNKLPIELSIDVRFHLSALATGIKIHSLQILPWLILHPFARLSFYSNAGTGISVGSDLEFVLYKRLHLSVRINYEREDLLIEPLGHQNGLNVLAWIGILLGKR